MENPNLFEANALILFADIIDSCSYSSILGAKEYAKKAFRFQSLFCELGNEYFKDSLELDNTKNHFRVSAYGDEGHIFIVREQADWGDLIFQAIQFSFELKARLKLLNYKKNDIVENDLSPQDMRIAVGIHSGTVMALCPAELDKSSGRFRTIIKDIIGYNINYAKRIESIARIGKNSQIFLSPEAANLLNVFPIALQKYETSLKGLSQNDIVFEVGGAFFDNKFPLTEEIRSIDQDMDSFYDFYLDEKKYISILLREPWLKSFIFSVIFNRCLNAKGNLNKENYIKKLQKLTWQNYNENDALILFCRAKELEDNKKFTSAIAILKDILIKYPDFVFAKIRLIKNCYEIIKSKTKYSAEEIFVRDTIEEFLENYPSLLTEKDKNDFNAILKEIKELLENKTNP